MKRMLLTTTIVAINIIVRTVRHETAGPVGHEEEAMSAVVVRGDDPASLFAIPSIAAERRADGSTIVRSTVPLKPAGRCVGDWLEHWAVVVPDRVFLGERSGEAPWATVTYGMARRQVRSIAAWILAQGLSAERPLAILSDNSVHHALLALGAMHAGVPVAAISPAYSLMSKDFDKLKSMIALLKPGAYVRADFSAALMAAGSAGPSASAAGSVTAS